ncbi:hypothetical protein VPH35_037256 [Triticum aestivum]|uniref:Uncharacterized protein n=2 Tax=Aegilops tauschii TaxID=37682 RepID=A0A453BRP7_AEGTS
MAVAAVLLCNAFCWCSGAMMQRSLALQSGLGSDAAGRTRAKVLRSPVLSSRSQNGFCRGAAMQRSRRAELQLSVAGVVEAAMGMEWTPSELQWSAAGVVEAAMAMEWTPSELQWSAAGAAMKLPPELQ